MATLEQLQDALINADKAGDTQAAQMLADEIMRMRSSQQPQTTLGADRAQANDAQVAEQTAIGRREAYNQKPWYSQAAQAADDEMRLLASGISMGFGDKFSAYMNSGDKSYADQLKVEREATQAARDRASSAAIPSEIAGAVMTGSLAANSGATLAGRLGTANMTGIKGVLARAGLMAPEGAIYGAVDAAGNDKNIKEGAITGAIAAPVGSVVGDTVSKVASKILPPKTASSIPSLDALKKQANDAYDAADKAGVVVTPQAVQRLKAKVEQDLVDFGYHPSVQPGIKAALDDLERISQGNVTLKGLDITRRIAKNAYTPTNPSQSEASRLVTGAIDDFIGKLNPNDLVMGSKKDGLNSLMKGRELWSRVHKNEDFMDAVESASLRAASTGSGGNVENATRQNLRRMIDPTSRSARRNWTKAEKDAIEEIVRGTPTQNVLRLAGKLSPQGNGLMAALGVGGAMTNPVLGVPALGGLAAKYAADKGVMNAVQRLDELIRVGGSPQALQAAQGALRSLTRAQREAVARVVQMAIIQTEVGQQEPAQQ